jgi:hypothetical protein
LIQQALRMPANVMGAVIPGNGSTATDPALVQADVLRFADAFTGHTTVGIDAYIRKVDTPAARLRALGWRLKLDSAVVAIATGPNPYVSVLDLVTLTSLTRAILERRAADPKFEGAFDTWLAEARTLEVYVWKMADDVITVEQQEEFRAVLNRWIAENASRRMAFFRRPQELATGIRESQKDTSSTSSVFSVVGLDPMAGLDPAVREAARARLFAERALYTSQRIPFLLSWHSELLVQQLLNQDTVANVLASIERLSDATEAVSRTAAELPQQIAAERQALIDALTAQQGQLRELSAEVGKTLDAGEKMSTSVNTALVTFDKLMDRFGVGDGKPRDPGSRRFDILDYAQTAEKISAMAEQVNTLVKDTGSTLDAPALDQRIAALKAAAAEARAEAESVLNHAFVLLAALVLLIFACAMLYRRTGRRPVANA